MGIVSWLPALSTTGLLAAVLWLGRNLILTRLKNSVEHEFNAKLEELRTQLRQSEEVFKADLRTKEAEIEGLRNGALTALASRQMALDKRRLEAVDQLWSAVISLTSARFVSQMLSVINLDVAAKMTEQNPESRKLFEMFDKNYDLKSMDTSGAQKARPYVTPMTWAIYSALSSITLHAIMCCEILKSGIGTLKIIDTKSINKLAKAALPEHVEYIDKFGPSGYHFLLERLDEKLLQEINSMLSGESVDRGSVQKAAEIIKLADIVSKENDAREIPEG